MTETKNEFSLIRAAAKPPGERTSKFLSALLMLVFAWGGHAAVVYQQDFEKGTDGTWSGGGTVQPTFGLESFGLGSNHLRNVTTDASVLTLTGLPPHSSMTLTFDLVLWDSVDFHDSCEGCVDRFLISIDGTILYNGNIGNYVGTPIATYGNSYGPGTPITPDFNAYYTPDYGYGTFRDSARRVAYTFAHEAASGVFAFQYPNSQGGVDESFGLDNVTVSINSNTVPKLLNCLVTPPGLGTLAAITGRVEGGTPGTVAIIEVSSDLGATDPWENIGSVVLGANGTSKFGPFEDPHSAGLNADFFRVRCP